MDTFFTKSGSSPGATEILADAVLYNAGWTLVSVLHQSPILVLFRANGLNDNELHLMRVVDLSHHNILRKLEGR